MKIALGELPPAGATAVTMAKTHINLVPPEHKEPIINAAQQQINPYLDLILGPQADHAAAIVHGVLAPYESIIGRNDPAVLKAEVVARVLLAVIAQALLLVGRPKDACVAYGYCAHVFGPAGGEEAEELRQQSHILRPQSVHHREARKVEREIYRFWGDAAMQAGGKADAERVHALGVSRGVWPSLTQRPVGQIDRRLTARPFWSSDDIPAAKALEAAHPTILHELQRVMALQERASKKQGMKDVFAVYKSDTVKSGAWTDFQLYANGQRDEANARLCPKTAECIASQPAFNQMLVGAHFFSRLAPGTHIGAHCGPSNLRLRCHLGLMVPKGCRIRVGTEVREWKEGECLIFDDSFEHEVFHDGDSDRVVLICDLWHPELDVDDDIIPTLTDTEKAALLAARKGEHQTLTERHYTIGGSVRRAP